MICETLWESLDVLRLGEAYLTRRVEATRVVPLVDMATAKTCVGDRLIG